MAAQSREDRLPTAWGQEIANAYEARAHTTWDGNDVSIRMAGEFRTTGAPAEWELLWSGSLDTDYPVSGTLTCRIPGVGLPEFSVSDARSGTPTGTEVDMVFAAVGAARQFLRRWRGGEESSTARAPSAQSPHAFPPEGWRVLDPQGVVTTEMIETLRTWPPSSHVRSARFDESTHVSFDPAIGTLTLRTVHRWGADVCRHQLALGHTLVERLHTWT